MTSSRPSGDQSLTNSLSELRVTCSAGPPAVGIFQTSACPSRSESKASQRPSGETASFSICSLPNVTCVASATEATPDAGIGMDQMWAPGVNDEYASTVPSAETD